VTGETLGRLVTTGAVLLVATIAAVVSFVHIEHLAVTHGQTELASELLPLSIDGTVAAASMVMLRAARAGLGTPRLARFMLGLAVTATLGANVGYGLPYGMAGALLSGWPAIAFIGCADMAISMVRKVAGQRHGQPAHGDRPAPPVAAAANGRPVAVDVNRTARRPRSAARRGQAQRSRADTEAAALAVLSGQPEISGTDLGRAVGMSERTGRRLLAQLSAGGANGQDNPASRISG
jgi:hypothetical protein